MRSFQLQLKFFCVCLFLYTGACKKDPFKEFLGKNEDEKEYPEGHVGPRTVNYRNLTVVEYPVTCTKENALSDIGEVTLTVRMRTKEEPTRFVFSKVPGNPLSLAGLGKFFHSRHIVHAYKDCNRLGPGQFNCNSSDVKTVDEGKPIYICDRNPKPNTMEHEVLAAFLGLYQLKVDFPADFDLNEVIFFPRIEDTIEIPGSAPLVTPSIDNAFWSRDSRGIQRITFLPTSKETERNYPIRLPRQPPLAAHEGGHRIFSKLGEPLLLAQNALRETLEGEAGEFDDTDQSWTTFNASAQQNATEVSRGAVTMSAVISSINEGIADIVAAIVAGLNLYLLSAGFEYGNMKLARDPYSKITDDGKIKALTASVIKHFFRAVDKSRNLGLTPNHKDVHTLGAIFAFTFLDLFREKMERENLSKEAAIPTAREKLKTFIARLNKAYANFPPRDAPEADRARSTDPKMLLSYLLREMISLYMPANGTLTNEQCNITFTHFPALIDEWRANVLRSCNF